MKQRIHLLGGLFSVLIAFSVQGGDNTVDMKFAPSKDTFIKREPIIVTCTLSNLSSNVITMNLGYDRVKGFLFSLDGSKQFNNSRFEGGISRGSDVTLKPGEAYQSRIILDEWILPLKNGSNSITACLNYNGSKFTNVFTVKLVEPTGNDLEVALGALITRAATTKDMEEQIDLERGLRVAAEQSPRVRAFLNRQAAELKSIIENIGRVFVD
jgi:hypothetical protein